MGELTSAVAVPQRPREWLQLSTVSRPESLHYLLIVGQLAMLFYLLRLFDIEPASGLIRILPLVLVGFVIHSAIPLRWRTAFFLGLFAAIAGVLLGPLPALALLLLALLLFGICHLPAAFSLRIALLVAVGLGLATIRAGWVTIPDALALPALPRLVLPVLGSMFMFRLIIYLYDLRHEERGPARASAGKSPGSESASFLGRLSYFLLFPNVCFLLFPVVDYRTFRRTYYDTHARAIYQKGAWWICLGLIYILAYRLVYHFLVPAPEDVQGLPGVLRFMTASYLVYLRVVGQFHLAIGLLCLFGFNLPSAHRFYLLASSFTDFWRRARIEWKDFMVKIFYYPSLVPLQRRLGTTGALVISTVVVFIATWFLHSYQWFWLLGGIRLSGTDGVFWTVIGACVLGNSLIEAKGPRGRAESQWMFRSALIRSLKVFGMFAFMSVIWSYWSSPSFSVWLAYLTALEDTRPADYAVLTVTIGLLVAAGAAVQLLLARATSASGMRRPKNNAHFGMAELWRPAAVFSLGLLLVVSHVPSMTRTDDRPIAAALQAVSNNRLNIVDEDREQRGYYEELMDETRSSAFALSARGLSQVEELKARSGERRPEPERQP